MKKIVSILIGALMCVTVIYSVAGTPTLNADADHVRSNLSQPAWSENVSWDNGLPDGRNGVSIGGWPGYTREVIDDIHLSDPQFITGGSFRIVTYSGSGPGQITGVTINIYPDSGGAPGTTVYATETASFTAALTGSMYFSRPEILYTCSFDAIVLPPGTWWVGFYPTSVENLYWLTSTKVGTSEIYFAYPDEGYNKWTAGHLNFNEYYDVSFTLSGEHAVDTTPPVTMCVLIGDMNGSIYANDVTVVLSATDFFTGINYTKYRLDDGGWNTYTTSFIVTANGEHTLYFYSVDLVGNFEEAKNTTFTIEHDVSVEITLKGGLGANAVIKNVGTKNLTGLPWDITLSGGIIFLGKQISGSVDIAPGAEITVKDFVFGFGKTIITATAGNVEKTTTGKVILFFISGVA
ncbi:MAG TPA: hypothetical protein VN377_03815 [Candidatus Thermoplasmatota archaeon]|nr:hypothetical protein [Candidatus Thermoplasmatota archaeon]